MSRIHLKDEGTNPKGLDIARLPDGRIHLGGYYISSADWEKAKKAVGKAPVATPAKDTGTDTGNAQNEAGRSDS